MTMIRSYGVYWHADRVRWVSPGPNNAVASLGAKTKSTRARVVDFPKQRGIFALYADYDLVHDGQMGSGNDYLFKGLKAYRFDHLSELWNRFSWFGTQWVTRVNELKSDRSNANTSTATLLNSLEAIVVAIAEPRLNLQRGHWGDVEKYYQYWPRTASVEELEGV